MIAILQPHIPHYREEFFRRISSDLKYDLFCYERAETVKSNHFSAADISVKSIRTITRRPFLVYNPFAFRKYKVLVLMLNFTHLTTWLLLLTKFLHRKKIILWGHGISVKRYAKEKKKPSVLLSTMIKMADSVWLYTEKEANIWNLRFPQKKIIALNNTISDVESILELRPFELDEIKQKYGIKQERIFIYCARFTEPARRVDMLEQIIEKLDDKRFGFVIIGEGVLKPDFSKYKNVYDFGAVYDRKMKDELFSISDIYIQPGWVGLSVVEAMAYGKPVITYTRSETHLQCVEYAYIENGVNGKIFSSEAQLLEFVCRVTQQELREMGLRAKSYVKEKLTMESMSGNAIENLRVFVS